MALPENSDDIITPTIKQLTPSISDPSVVEDDMDTDLRQRSPSPEVELYSPELEQDNPITPPTPGEPFSGRSSLNPDGHTEVRHRPNRAPSPPLEADERGFTETATAVRARGMSLHNPIIQASVEIEQIQISEETPEQGHRRDQELGYELFGQSHSNLPIPEQKIFTSSPMIQPRNDNHTVINKMNFNLSLDDIEMADANWSMMSPENIDVEEIDLLFSEY